MVRRLVPARSTAARQRALVTSALLLSLALPARADAARHAYDPALGAAVGAALRVAARAEEPVAVKPVYVKCYRDRTAFEAPLLPRFGVPREDAGSLTAYYAGGGEVHLRAGSCANARLFVRGIVRWDTAAAMSVLLHESLHRQGLRSERATTCLASDAVRWAAKEIGLGDLGANRARLLAFRYAARYVPSTYRMSRGACLGLIAGDDVTWSRAVRSRRLEQRFR